MENVVGRYSSNVIRSGKDININVDIQQNPRLAKIMGLTFRRNEDQSYEILETGPKIIESGILKKSSEVRKMTAQDIRNENLQHSSTSPKISRNSAERVGQRTNEIENIPIAWQNAFSLWGPVESSSPEPIDHDGDQFYSDGANQNVPEAPIVESDTEIPYRNDKFDENAEKNDEITRETVENVQRSRKTVDRGKRRKKNLNVVNLKRKFRGFSRRKNKKIRSISDDIENQSESMKTDNMKVNKETNDERNKGNRSPSLFSLDGKKTRRRDCGEDDTDSDDDNSGGDDDHQNVRTVVSNNHTSIKSKQRKTPANFVSINASVSSRTRRSKCLTIPEKDVDTNSNGSSTRWIVTSNHNKQRSHSGGRRTLSRAIVQNHVGVETEEEEEENPYDDRTQEQPHEEGIQEEQLLVFYDNCARKRKKKNSSSRNGKKTKSCKENSTNVQSDEQPDEEGIHEDRSYISMPVKVKMEVESRTSSPAPSTTSTRSSIHSQSAYVSSVFRTQLTDNARLTV
jgi:hypothetical protein